MKGKQIKWLLWKFRGSNVKIKKEEKNRKNKTIDTKLKVNKLNVPPRKRESVEVIPTT